MKQHELQKTDTAAKAQRSAHHRYQHLGDQFKDEGISLNVITVFPVCGLCVMMKIAYH